MPVGAVIGGAVIAGGATVASGAMASHAQKSAANTAASTQQQTTDKNNALSREIYSENATRLDPYSRAGMAAGDEYMGLLLGDAPKTAGTGSGWFPVTPAPATPAHAGALGTVPGTTPAPASALGSYGGNPQVAQQAQAAIAAGADPAAVRARAASMGVSI